MLKSITVFLTCGLTVLGVCGSAHAAPAPITRSAATHVPPSRATVPHNPLLKEILAEDDDEDEPDAPNLSAQCQRFVSKPNPYHPTGSNVDMISGDNIVASGSQAGCYTAQNETSIASNPANPANIVAGANDYRNYNTREGRNDSGSYAYTSMDGGLTWTDVLAPGLTYSTGATGALRAMDASGDPIIKFGPNNTVYYGNILFSRGEPADGGTEAPSAIAVNVSHDGGLTFGQPHIVAINGAGAHGASTPTHVFNDKIWMAVDQNTGELYVTWTRFLDTPDGGYAESPIVVATSTDQGRTFSHYRRIDPVAGTNNPGLQPYSQGSNPVVGPDGTLYVGYETSYCQTAACDRPSDRDVTVVATSTNHGRTFGRSVVGTNYDFPVDEEVGTNALTGEHFRINSFPQLTIDPVTTQLLVTWNDDRNGRYNADGESVKTNGDNIVSTSTDGVNWTRPIAVGTGQDEVFGAIASYNGVAAVVSYTRHYQPDNVRLDFAYWPIVASATRPISSGPVHRITTQSSDPRGQFLAIGADGKVLQGAFIGDYAAVSIGADLRLHPAWTDFRGNPGLTKPNQDAYTDTIDLG